MIAALAIEFGEFQLPKTIFWFSLKCSVLNKAIAFCLKNHLILHLKLRLGSPVLLKVNHICKTKQKLCGCWKKLTETLSLRKKKKALFCVQSIRRYDVQGQCPFCSNGRGTGQPKLSLLQRRKGTKASFSEACWNHIRSQDSGKKTGWTDL